MPAPTGPVTNTSTAHAPAQTTVAVKTGPLRWHITAGFLTRLFQQDSPNWLDLDHDHHAQLVKANPRRRTYRVRFADLDLFAKTYRPAEWTDTLKWLLRPAPSAAEFHILQLAQQRAVPAPAPIAYAQGSLKHKPFAILLTKSLCPARSLLDILYDPQPPAETDLTATLDATARLVARLHCAGINHHDLHPGNILLTEHTPGQTQAHITDLQNVRTQQRSGHASADTLQPARLANLALLYSGLRLRLPQHLLDRFLSRYRQTAQPHRRWTPAELDLFQQRLLHYAHRQDRRIWLSRDRRALRNTPYSQHINIAPGWTARVFLQAKHPPKTSQAAQHRYTPKDWQKALAHPLALLQNGHPLKNGGRNTVLHRPLNVPPANLNLVVKHCRLRPGRIKRSLDMFRRSRALRQYHQAHILINRSLPTAWPLAALEHRSPFLNQSIVLTEFIPHAHTLLQLIQQDSLPQGTRRRQLIHTLAHLLAQLARKGLRHRDCKASNLLIQNASELPSTWRVFFIDLHGVRRCLVTHRPQHHAAIRLAASLLPHHPKIYRTDYIRFLRRYAQHLDLTEAENPHTFKKLLRRLERKARHHYHNSRTHAQTTTNSPHAKTP